MKTADCADGGVKKKAWIRPVYAGERLVSYALCRTDGELLVDSDVIDHFDLEYTGKMIEETAVEFHGVDECDWAMPIYTEAIGGAE